MEADFVLSFLLSSVLPLFPPLFLSLVLVFRPSYFVLLLGCPVITKAPVHDSRGAELSGRRTGRGGRYRVRVAQQVEGQGRIPLGLQVRALVTLTLTPTLGSPL